MTFRLSFFLLGAALVACTSGASSTETTTCDGEIHAETLSLESDAEGSVSIPVSVDGNDNAFMVLTQRASGTVSTDRVVDGEEATALDWEDWSTGHTSLTNAFFATEDVSVLNWPIREEDGPLAAGDWIVVASTLDKDGYYKGNQSVEVAVIRRSCSGGTPSLPITIAYAGGLEKDKEVTSAVEAAADRWVTIYGDIGVEITVEYVSVNLDGSLPEPLPGDDAYTEVYEAVGEGVVVVVGDDVAGNANLYGEAGGIPGPIIPSPHSVVAVSWLVHAGPDAAFNDEEIEIFAETMAHEAGHFLGLYHPVEDGWTYWDALDDTKKCSSEASCESALSTNLMFPYPVCTARCVEQVALSDGQVGVILNNVGVR